MRYELRNARTKMTSWTFESHTLSLSLSVGPDGTHRHWLGDRTDPPGQALVTLAMEHSETRGFWMQRSFWVWNQLLQVKNSTKHLSPAAELWASRVRIPAFYVQGQDMEKQLKYFLASIKQLKVEFFFGFYSSFI